MALTLNQIFDTVITRQCDKWEPYFDVYETYFSKWRNQSPTFVEVGVQNGGSLEMWVEYFGPNAHIFGIDIKPLVDSVPGSEIVIGDQSSEEFWDGFLPKVGPIDLFLDDGGHTMQQQLVTFKKVWPHIVDGGVFVCEDTHTAYWPGWGGGYKKEGSFIEFAKQFADVVHSEHLQGAGDEAYRALPKDVAQVSFFNSQVVFVKGKPAFNRLIQNKKD